ncbi:MAG: hypothetical protein L6Q98_08420 [Anaerolineae bacterium]|nr:hypothetical protein [Anaerolineae bacterium]NUQ02613.1 hypothetical protein [Anaerolineae bacterium]
MIRKILVTPTLAGSNGSASGSKSTDAPHNGRLVGVHVAPGDQPNTLDVTIKALLPDQTLLTLTNVSAAAWYYPTVQVSGPTGAALTYNGTQTVNAPAPLEGYINVAGAQGNAGTFDVYLLIES